MVEIVDNRDRVVTVVEVGEEEHHCCLYYQT